MQDYNTIIGSIQMRLNNCPTRSVMDRYNIGSGTLNLIMSRYKASGIPIEELRMMPPKDVEELFYPSKNLQRKDCSLRPLAVGNAFFNGRYAEQNGRSYLVDC